MQMIPNLLYPFFCWWTFRLLPHLGYGKKCCNEHWDTCILSDHIGKDNIFFFFFPVTETSSCQRQNPLFWGLKLIQVMFLCKRKQIKLLMQIWPQCFKETLGGTNSYFFNFFLCSPLSTLYLFSPLSFNFRVPFPPIELAVKEQL